MSFSLPHRPLFMASPLLLHPMVPGRRLMAAWSRFVAVVLIVTMTGLIIAPTGLTLAEEQTFGAEGSEGTGIQVASWALTVPYCLGKTAFAVAGGIVGGLGYVFSGGNPAPAQAVWTTSIYGTYILRPAHLRGEEPIQFLGKAERDHDKPVAHPVKPAPQTSDPARNK